jgi:hypothetical protein
MSDQIMISAIQKLAGIQNDDKVRLLQCSVDSVDLDKRTCSVTTISGKSNISFDVQLMAGVADGLLIEPAVNSMVYILMSRYTLPFVVQYSDVVSYSLNGDEFGGMVKVIELTQKINALETLLNEILLWSATVTPSFTSQPIVLTQQTEIENKSIQHGE